MREPQNISRMSSPKGVIASLIGLAGFIAIVAVISHYVPLVDDMASVQERVMMLGPWAAVCYPFLFALCNLLLLPGGILTVGAGFFFGLWWGFTLIFVGNVISAAIAFALARGAARPWLTSRFSNSPILQSLEPAIAKEAWKVVFLTQLHPLFPTSLITYLYGLTSINFRTYMTWLCLGRAPALFLYVYFGTLGQHGMNIAQGKAHPRIVEYWTWGGAFVVGALLLMVGSRIASTAIKHTRMSDIKY